MFINFELNASIIFIIIITANRIHMLYMSKSNYRWHSSRLELYLSFRRKYTPLKGIYISSCCLSGWLTAFLCDEGLGMSYHFGQLSFIDIPSNGGYCDAVGSDTLSSHLWGMWFKPWTLCNRVDSCLLMVSSLLYRTLTNCVYWFPLPINYLSWYDLYCVESDVKPQINK